MKLIDLINANRSLNVFNGVPFKAGIAFRMSCNIRNIQPVLENYNKTREELFKKYGEETDEVGKYKVPLENQLELEEEVQLLLDEEVTIDIKSVTLKDLEDANVTLSPVEMLQLVDSGFVVE